VKVEIKSVFTFKF